MLRIQSAFPLKEMLDFVNEVSVETVEEIWRRVDGGTISFRAATRSYRVSPSTSRSDSTEISDSKVRLKS